MHSVLLLVGALVVNGPAPHCEKLVGWRDQPPYTMQAADGEIAGLHADLVREALKRLGCRAKFLNRPWARAMVQIRFGELDIMAGAGKNPERETYAWFSQPTNKAANVLFMNRSAFANFHFTRLSQIADTDFRLSVAVNADYGGDYTALQNDPKFQHNLRPYSSRTSAWQMLALGRVDGIISDQLSGQYEINSLHLNKVAVASDVVINPQDVDYVAISKKRNEAAFVALFDKQLSDMMEDGTYTKILQKYKACALSLIRKPCSNP